MCTKQEVKGVLRAVVLLFGPKENPSSGIVAEIPEDVVDKGKHLFSLSKPSSLKKKTINTWWDIIFYSI